MHKNLIIYIFGFVFSVGIFSSLLPYPILSNYTNITAKQSHEINVYQETETQNFTNASNTMLDLSWQEGIDSLFSFDTPYQIIDITTEESFFIQRIGGKNHADVVADSEEDAETIKTIYKENTKFSIYPILLKLNEQAYIPASFSPYLHGFGNNQSQGHFCMHFKDSKTDSTNTIDFLQQKTVKEAKEKGNKLLNTLD